jgi:hypothetical protein
MQPGGVWRSGEAAWRRFLFSWLRRRSSLAEAMRAAVLWQPDGAVSIFPLLFTLDVPFHL